MPYEIERKFLVLGSDWKPLAPGIHYKQGYLSTDPECTVRIRIEGTVAKLTVKGKNDGITRLEFEKTITLAAAEALFASIDPETVIEKIRRKILFEGKVWEVDEFLENNEGLYLAEIELQTPDEVFIKPAWIGKEVSDDPRYFNSYLADHPYKTWKS